MSLWLGNVPPRLCANLALVAILWCSWELVQSLGGGRFLEEVRSLTPFFLFRLPQHHGPINNEAQWLTNTHGDL